MADAPRPTLTAFLLGCAALGVTSFSPAQTALPKSSPFMSATAPAAASAPGETIEFAAVRTIGKRTEIDLYDTQGKKHHWIPLGTTADGMTVMSYDARRDQVTATIGGVNKTLLLRQSRGTAAGNAALTAQPATMSFATPDPSFAQKTPPPPAPQPTAASAVMAPATDANATPVAAATAPAQPAVPLTIARQEEEARMLVSDLLEIGMAQRKAYEEKQKKAADPNAAPAPAETPAPTPPQKPDGAPDGG
jgi:hypothetical protein